MIIVRGSSRFAAPPACSLTVGNFDGVHLGHRELLRRTVARGRSAGVPSAVLTFFPHPVRFFSPSARFYEITTPEEKASLIEAAGIDTLVVESFTGETGRMPPEEFAAEILCRRLHARYVTVGYDFTFGKDRSGSPAMLAGIGRDKGFEVDIVPPLVRGGVIVSSTRIRDLLMAGRVREAEELLGRPYKVSGPVVRGAGRGKNLGFPTANIQAVQELIPLPGVYVVEVEVGGDTLRSVANVGFNPTFGENSLGVEVHILDFEGDLYGREISILFRDRVRDERKFKGVDGLVRQIAKDVQYAREARFHARRGPAEKAGPGAAEGSR